MFCNFVDETTILSRSESDVEENIYVSVSGEDCHVTQLIPRRGLSDYNFNNLAVLKYDCDDERVKPTIDLADSREVLTNVNLSVLFFDELERLHVRLCGGFQKFASKILL